MADCCLALTHVTSSALVATNNQSINKNEPIVKSISKPSKPLTQASRPSAEYHPTRPSAEYPTRPSAEYVPEDFKVSTITAIGSLNTAIDLPVLFSNLPILDPNDRISNGITFAEFGRTAAGKINHRGEHKKVALSEKRPPPKTRRFDNQVTIVYRKRVQISDPLHIPLEFKDDFQYVPETEGNFVQANMKVFNTGNVQITGLKYMNHGQEFIDTIVDLIQLLKNMGINVAKTPETLHASNYAVQLINTDFRVGFQIKREKLYRILVDEYDMQGRVTYEPCIYPGVKIQYMWNTDRDSDAIRDSNGQNSNAPTPTQMQGICTCSPKCKGKNKGTGQGPHQCKRVTIAVFQSGCIIITGAQTQKQINDAYTFINGVIKEHFDDVYKPTIEERIAQLQITNKSTPILALPAPASASTKPKAIENKAKPVLTLTHKK